MPVYQHQNLLKKRRKSLQMDSDDFILELLADSQSPAMVSQQSCWPMEYSATAVTSASRSRTTWNPQTATQSNSSDDLIGDLNTWDFAVMRSEFGDLQSFDSAALISLYRPSTLEEHDSVAAVAETVNDDIVEEDDDGSARCRSDSGYSSTACGQWWADCYSPGLSSSSSSSSSSVPDYSQSPVAATAAPAGRGQRRSGGAAVSVRKPRARLTKSRQMQLWQFLYHQLHLHGSETSAAATPLRWESRDEGTFRIVNPTALADAWGAHRRRGNMTYEKMSRTLRYYYDRRLITKVAGKQHTYRFHFDQFPDL